MRGRLYSFFINQVVAEKVVYSQERGYVSG